MSEDDCPIGDATGDFACGTANAPAFRGLPAGLETELRASLAPVDPSIGGADQQALARAARSWLMKTLGMSEPAANLMFMRRVVRLLNYDAETRASRSSEHHHIRFLIERIRELTTEVIASFAGGRSVAQRMSLLLHITSEMLYDIAPVLRWAERRAPIAAELPKSRLFYAIDEAQALVTYDIPEYSGGRPQFVDHPSDQAIRTGTLGVVANELAETLHGWTDDMEKEQAATDEIVWTEPRSRSQWAVVFDVNVKTITTWFKSGQVRAKKIGKYWAINTKDLPPEQK